MFLKIYTDIPPFSNLEQRVIKKILKLQYYENKFLSIYHVSIGNVFYARTSPHALMQSTL